jgi:hypothetical protein
VPAIEWYDRCVIPGWTFGVFVACVLVTGSAPARAGDVRIGITIGPPPPIVVAAPSQLVVVPGTPVYYAPGGEFNFFG